MAKTIDIDEEIQNSDIITGAPSGSLSTVNSAGVVGEVDSSEVRFPKLQIVQGVGPLSEMDEFRKGDIVLNQELKIGGIDDPIELTVLQIGKMYEEVVDYDSDDIPRIVNSKEEVLKLGGTTEGHREGGEWIKPTWRAVAEAMVCLKAPDSLSKEDAETHFGFEAPKDKGKYAFAKWTIKGVAYKFAAVEIFSAAAMYYRDGLKKGSFHLSTQKRSFGPNTVMVPVVKKGSRNTPEFSSWLSEFA